jgi:hypothetical protein
MASNIGIMAECRDATMEVRVGDIDLASVV